MTAGYLGLVLHAHLPFVRHPEDATVMEERWLYEAIVDTYLPLLEVFEGLAAERVHARVTLSLSQPLIAMLDDPLLRARAAAHLDDLVELAEREVARTDGDAGFAPLAALYRRRFEQQRALWQRHRGQLVDAFAALHRDGVLELVTSTATHAFLPLLDRNWPALRAQVATAARHFERRFGFRSRGMWLGECAYEPGCDALLREAGVRFFVVDSHALRLAEPPAVGGVHAPVYCPSGVAAFGRDPDCSERVWSAQSGYPGDPLYRDFYRDIGFDLDAGALGRFQHPSGARLYTGIKYHAITHPQLHDKRMYDPAAARARVGLHAAHFRTALERQVGRLAEQLGRPPVVVAPYDAELFGHWWFEGPQFLGDLLRQLHYDQTAVEPVSLGEFLELFPTQQVATPSASSWGEGGYHDYWLNERSAWIYPHLHHAATRMVELADRHPEAGGLVRRALDQAARELLLLQSSDWPFIMRTGTTVAYAERRIKEHLERFGALDHQLAAGAIDERWLREIEARDNLFPHVDYRDYRSPIDE